MARVPITEFGVIQKLLAGATVQVFSANDSGENTGTLATLYQAATGSGVVSNPQTLDEDGKLSVDCYVDGIVVAEISNISDLADRSLKKLRANPTQFPLGATNAALEGANVIGSVDDAEAAATQAGAYLDLMEDTFQGIPSTSNLSISSGSKTFTVASGLPFGVGQYIIATSNSNPTTHSMNGQVTAYSGTSLTITVDAFLGSGSRADWTIRGSGPRGATGATGPAGSGSGDMLKSENLSGLANYTTARSNLGLGTAAQAASTDFATAAQGAKADTATQPADLVAALLASPFVAKAIGNFNGTGVVAFRKQYGCSNITDLGTGNYRITLSTAMADTDYIVIANSKEVANASIGWECKVWNQTTTTFDIATAADSSTSGTKVDNYLVMFAVFGD